MMRLRNAIFTTITAAAAAAATTVAAAAAATTVAAAAHLAVLDYSSVLVAATVGHSIAAHSVLDSHSWDSISSSLTLMTE